MRRFRGLASRLGAPASASVNRVDTYAAGRPHTSCVAPFCGPDVRVRHDDEWKLTSANCCDNPREAILVPLHVDLSKDQTRPSGRSELLRAPAAGSERFDPRRRELLGIAPEGAAI